MRNRFGLISHARRDQQHLVLELCAGFCLDNGAFSAWRRGETVDWNKYQQWVLEMSTHPGYQFAILPDVVDGTEEENDALLDAWKLPCGVPVFHQGEDFNRLEWLMAHYPMIAISSVEKSLPSVTFDEWMTECMKVLCRPNGTPRVRIHGLRMLNHKIFTKYPLYSADSSVVGQNCADPGKFTGSFAPVSTEVRGAVMLDRLDSYQSPWSFKPAPVEQLPLFG